MPTAASTDARYGREPELTRRTPSFPSSATDNEGCANTLTGQPDLGGEASDVLRVHDTGDKDSVGSGSCVQVCALHDSVHRGLLVKPKIVHPGIDEHVGGPPFYGCDLGDNGSRIHQMP